MVVVAGAAAVAAAVAAVAVVAAELDSFFLSRGTA